MPYWIITRLPNGDLGAHPEYSYRKAIKSVKTFKRMGVKAWIRTSLPKVKGRTYHAK